MLLSEQGARQLGISEKTRVQRLSVGCKKGALTVAMPTLNFLNNHGEAWTLEEQSGTDSLAFRVFPSLALELRGEQLVVGETLFEPNMASNHRTLAYFLGAPETLNIGIPRNSGPSNRPLGCWLLVEWFPLKSP